MLVGFGCEPEDGRGRSDDGRVLSERAADFSQDAMSGDGRDRKRELSADSTDV